MRIRVSVPEEHVSPTVVNAALEAVTRLDEQLIRSGQSPTASQLIANGAKWRPEPPGDECFDHGQDAIQFLPGSHRSCPRTRGLATHVDDVRALLDHFQRPFHRAAGIDPEASV